MKDSDYWRSRFGQLEAAQNQRGADTYAEIEKIYRQAQKEIEGKINTWYQRFATNNGVSMAEASQILRGKDLEEFKWSVQDYIRYGRKNADNGAWEKQLENASARYHISRLEALKLQTQQSLEIMFGNQLDRVDAGMKRIYLDGYYHTAYELQKGFRIGWDIAGLDQAQIEKVIRKPWAVDGKNFSERIWGNKAKLISEVHKELTQNIMLGADPQKAIDAIAKKMNISKYNAGRLVMTEEAYFSSAAQKDCFNDLDVEQYEIVATLDSHTSEICQEMDGKVFPMKDFEPGITAPPFHVFCRSTTVPHFDENFGQVGKRAARDEKTGKTYYVPADMTYKEWKESFVEGGDKSGLQEVKPDDTIKKMPELVHTLEEAKKALKDVVGFNDLEESLSKIDNDLLIANTNQLQILEQRFGAVHASIGTISSTHDRTAIAYVSSRTIQPTMQNLSLCPKYYKDKAGFLATEKRCVESGWSMPCALTDEELSIYTVTHEYGHMIQNMLIQRRMTNAGWEAENPGKFVDMTKRTRNAAYKWYNMQRETVRNECFSEIVQIAKDNNAEFNLADNLSKYGHSNKAEFFAEVFANSQLSEPNELGKAMNIWLERKGLIQ